MKMLADNSGEVLFNPDFFEVRHSAVANKHFKRVKPVLKYPNGEVKLDFNVGTRSNGADMPVWPHDLMTEVVI